MYGSAGMTNPMATAADLIVGGSNGAPTRLGVGANGQVLTVSAGALAYGSGAAVSWPLTNAGEMQFQPSGIANAALDLINAAAATNGIRITGTSTGGTIDTHAAGAIAVGSANATAVTVTPATTVTGLLTANGGVNVAGQLQANGAAGIAGQFMQTNGAAAPSWVSDTAGVCVAYSSDPRIAGALTTPTAAFGAANQAHYQRVRVGGGASAHIAIDVGTSSGNISVAYYTNTGTLDSAAPSSRVQTSGAVACPSAGYAATAVTSVAVIQGQHWIAMSCDNTTATFSRIYGNASNLGKGLCATQLTAHPLPSSAGTLAATAVSHDIVGVA